MRHAGPVIQCITGTAFRVPTDAPEPDGTLARDRTTRVLAEWFHDDVRIERMLFDGARVPHEGTIAPNMTRPGLGLSLKQKDAARYAA